MTLFHVLAQTSTGGVHELDVHAFDAPGAVARADVEIREQQPETRVTHVYARPIHELDEYAP